MGVDLYPSNLKQKGDYQSNGHDASISSRSRTDEGRAGGGEGEGKGKGEEDQESENNARCVAKPKAILFVVGFLCSITTAAKSHPMPFAS